MDSDPISDMDSNLILDLDFDLILDLDFDMILDLIYVFLIYPFTDGHILLGGPTGLDGGCIVLGNLHILDLTDGVGRSGDPNMTLQIGSGDRIGLRGLHLEAAYFFQFYLLQQPSFQLRSTRHLTSDRRTETTIVFVVDRGTKPLKPFIVNRRRSSLILVGSIVGNNSISVGFSSTHDDPVIRLRHLPYHRVPCIVPSSPVFSVSPSSPARGEVISRSWAFEWNLMVDQYDTEIELMNSSHGDLKFQRSIGILKIRVSLPYKIIRALLTGSSSVCSGPTGLDGGCMVLGNLHILDLTDGDKNLRIWGLDFGDCHKSIFAHADSVMDVQFVHNTHYMFSAGKDRLLKYWDADKFELLLTLEGHHAAVWCLAVSNRGDFVVTGSHDRSIRRWDRTEEPFFIEEEKEKRLDEIFEAYMDDTFEDRNAPKEELPEEGAVALAGKRTLETLTATDSIIDALEVAEVEFKRIAEHEEEQARGKVAEFQPNLIMLGLSPSGYVLRITILRCPQAALLYEGLDFKSWQSWPLCSYKCAYGWMFWIVTILLQTHHSLLISTPSARPVLSVLKEIIYARVKECHDTLGFNLAAMDHLKQLMASRSDALFRDAKLKLVEIRSQQLKRLEARTETKTEKRQKKKHKK
ncbi:aquaporin TIP1-1-like [Hibiscus syriacus]|uniref:Aquaporin TIP1-1-like n=1 Tax=Hibiscus syriacus TaxID=106335 RepID=A0A6A2YRD1_HIBSY|nr:aquaporin TIP1-1-like [Hibiscus syriacus]